MCILLTDRALLNYPDIASDLTIEHFKPYHTDVLFIDTMSQCLCSNCAEAVLARAAISAVRSDGLPGRSAGVHAARDLCHQATRHLRRG